MKDIPMFTNEYGVAGLVLREIPYRQIAYIRLLSTQQPEALLEECIGFCRACGAETIYATGHEMLEKSPLHTAVLQLRSPENLPATDAQLAPVSVDTLPQWLQIYNTAMDAVPNAAYMDTADGKAMLQAKDGYFIYRGQTLLGIGKASLGQLDAVVSCQKGAGAHCVSALCALSRGSSVILQVASANKRAISLYDRLGFTKEKELSRWYQVFPAK